MGLPELTDALRRWSDTTASEVTVSETHSNGPPLAVVRM